jgi:DNA-binding transcriptional LysR family regulator
LSVHELADLQHLDLSSVEHATDFVDRALAQRKLTRRIGLRAPFLSAEPILVRSDLISIIRRSVAEELVRRRSLVILPLPFPSPVTQTAMIWHRRFDRQPAHRWLRETVAKI